jgi:hypothetical protein
MLTPEQKDIIYIVLPYGTTLESLCELTGASLEDVSTLLCNDFGVDAELLKKSTALRIES